MRVRRLQTCCDRTAENSGQRSRYSGFTIEGSKDPEKIAKEAVKEAERKGCNVLIVDTAGRLQIDEELMEELVRLKASVKPHEILLCCRRSQVRMQ